MVNSPFFTVLVLNPVPENTSVPAIVTVAICVPPASENLNDHSYVVFASKLATSGIDTVPQSLTVRFVWVARLSLSAIATVLFATEKNIETNKLNSKHAKIIFLTLLFILCFFIYFSSFQFLATKIS